jgi:DNA-binding transcriptional regulator LsrR (DeoR family)
MDKVQEILEERNIFSECEAERINPALVFFEAFVYSNTELTNLTLELINRITNQRREILRTFKDIIFVAGGHLKSLAIRGVQTTRSVLLNLTAPTIREQGVGNNVLWITMTAAE